MFTLKNKGNDTFLENVKMKKNVYFYKVQQIIGQFANFQYDARKNANISEMVKIQAQNHYVKLQILYPYCNYGFQA